MKRTLAFALLLLALGAIGYFGVRIYQQAAAEQATQRRVQTLPALTLTTMEKDTLRRAALPEDTPAVLVFFRPACPYCQHEARSIRAHHALADTAAVLFISARPTSDLRAFADSLRLEGGSPIRVLRDGAGAALRTFGVERVPTTFVYDGEGTLIREFEGEVGASALYSVLSGTPSPPGR
jgi:peroxiredoxin